MKGAVMQRKPIDIAQLNIQPHKLFHTQWMLVTAGDYARGEFNTMTIGWGAIGTMWSKPFAFVAIRHSRYTFEFMEKFTTFTLTAFPPEHHDALNLLGSRSGRDGDKISSAGLTPEPSIQIAAPSFKEAEIVIECKKMYAHDLNPELFLDKTIHKHYPNKDFHRIYYGEILKTFAVDKYIA
jgi:flavin reductase (DIM6/NTAB) family NADH-FMN oxidoreductase RutF